MYYLMAATVLYALGMLGGRAGKYSVLAGLAVHGFFIAHRSLLLGKVPVTERLDILSLISFLMILAMLFIKQRHKTAGIENHLIPLSAFFAFTAMFHEPVNSVDLFMRSPWFYLFSIFNILSYVLFGAGAILGLMYLFGEDEALEPLQHRYSLYGWTAFSLSLLSGSVWFFLAYGSYWYWTAKEFWSSLTWLYYAVYLHSRYLADFRGRPAAVIGVLGYPLLLFNYFGIGTVIKSPWSQF